MKTIQDLSQRVRAEYLEMPGLRLKSEQVQRLCGIDRTICQQVLDELVNANFLSLKADGHYARLTEGYLPRSRATKADLTSKNASGRAS